MKRFHDDANDLIQLFRFGFYESSLKIFDEDLCQLQHRRVASVSVASLTAEVWLLIPTHVKQQA